MCTIGSDTPGGGPLGSFAGYFFAAAMEGEEGGVILTSVELEATGAAVGAVAGVAVVGAAAGGGEGAADEEDAITGLGFCC